MKTYGTMYYVNDMTEAIKYYTTVLGMKPTSESPGWSEFDMSGHRLCLHWKGSKDEQYPQNGILILYRDGIQKLFDSMKADGYKVFGLHQIYEEMHSFEFKDNSGCQLSFYGKIN